MLSHEIVISTVTYRSRGHPPAKLNIQLLFPVSHSCYKCLASTILRYPSLVSYRVQIRCTIPQANILCPSEMPSRTPEFKHTVALNQLATESEDNANIAADHAPYEHLDTSNYIGFIMVTAAIVVVLSLWAILSVRARRSKKKTGKGEAEDKQRAEKVSEERLKGTGHQTEARTEKVPDVCK